ncbi:MAG: MBOAT family protein [Oligoflexia bacterium]|nr:MBOAT family protein [Oligoflexia bacterium]
MLFNSLVFAVFLAVVWPVWRVLSRPLRRWFLLLASFVFYGWWDWRFLLLLLASGGVDWLCARAIPGSSPRRVRGLVTTSVVVNLSILGVFKYANFGLSEAARLLSLLGVDVMPPALSIVLPVGLSFYTFQSMAYTIDVARGAEPTRRLRDVLLYIAFFPQLVAGPIERSGRLMPQLLRQDDPNAADLRVGLELFAWGLFKKAVVADNLAPLVERAFDQADPGGLTVLLGAYAFAWQIYCDFSGYSDMARGLARLFGVDVMVNFKRPFFATGPRDLWRRWHISLSQWLRDYLYIPLGGSKGGRRATLRNLMITMVLGGLWHGASWTFIVWGAVHGLALVLAHLWRPSRVPRLVAILLTFHFTVLTFVIFRAHDLSQIWSLYLAVQQGLAPTALDLAGLRLLVLLVGCVLGWDLLCERRGKEVLLQDLPVFLRWGLVAGLLLAVAVLGGSYGRPFLYFQF